MHACLSLVVVSSTLDRRDHGVLLALATVATLLTIGGGGVDTSGGRSGSVRECQ
jgi:hypothetical protein